MPNRETQAISNENQFTDWVTPHGPGPHFAEIAAFGNASFVGTLSVQTKHPDDADSDAVDGDDTYTANTRKTVELPTSLSVRFGCKTGDFTSGAINVAVGKNPD